jgi:hypothetical protein
MSETYKFPDAEDIPKIKTTTDEPFELPESKNLFITYDSDEWESKSDVENVLQTINALFGTDVQIAILPDDFDLLTKDDVEDMLSELTD